MKRSWLCVAAVHLLVLPLLLSASPLLAENYGSTRKLLRTFHTPRFILHIGTSNPQPSEELPAVNADLIAERSISILDATFEELSRIFQATPKRQVVLRFLTPSEFKRVTGAPAWTSAMYFRDEITLPLTKNTERDEAELRRALRHEYVHAFIAELSDYRCPAWLDEGVAQILEGHPNPLLGPALREWIRDNNAIPLDWLHDGFTTLDAQYVPAAYAQSLFATRTLIRELGFSGVTNYLKHLREGRSEDQAFYFAFGRDKITFERELTGQIKRWAVSGQRHP